MRGNGFGRQVHRAAIAALTALAAALALAPAASAEPARYLWFFQAPEGAGVGASDYTGQPPNMRLEVVRNGQLIGAANGGPWSEAFVELSTLQVGDVANLYAGAALRASVAYDGKPTIPNPCVGSRVFTGTRSDGAVVEDAGAWSGSGSLGTFNWAVWDDENPFTVTLRYRLAATDHVYASTYQELPAVGVSSYLERGVGPCPPPPVVNPPAPFPVQPILTPVVPTARLAVAVRGPAQPGDGGSAAAQAAARGARAQTHARAPVHRVRAGQREVHAERARAASGSPPARSPSRRPARATSRCA